MVNQVFANVKSYYWKDFQCEICRHAYSCSYVTNGHKYSLVDL